MLLIMAGIYYKVKRTHNIAKAQSRWRRIMLHLIHHQVPKVGFHIPPPQATQKTGANPTKTNGRERAGAVNKQCGCRSRERTQWPRTWKEGLNYNACRSAVNKKAGAMAAEAHSDQNRIWGTERHHMQVYAASLKFAAWPRLCTIKACVPYL